MSSKSKKKQKASDKAGKGDTEPQKQKPQPPPPPTQEQRNETVLQLSQDLGAMMDAYNKQRPITEAAIERAKEEKDNLAGIEAGIVRKAGEIREAQTGVYQRRLNLQGSVKADDKKHDKKSAKEDKPTEAEQRKKVEADAKALREEAAKNIKSYRDLDTDGYEKLFAHLRSRAKRYEATTPHTLALVLYGSKADDCVKRAEAFCVELVADGYLTRADGDTKNVFHVERDKLMVKSDKEKAEVF